MLLTIIHPFLLWIWEIYRSHPPKIGERKRLRVCAWERVSLLFVQHKLRLQNLVLLPLPLLQTNIFFTVTHHQPSNHFSLSLSLQVFWWVHAKPQMWFSPRLKTLILKMLQKSWVTFSWTWKNLNLFVLLVVPTLCYKLSYWGLRATWVSLSRPLRLLRNFLLLHLTP